MLQIVNRSPLAAGLALFTDPDGRDLVSVAVKGTFQIPPPGESPMLAATHVPLRHADGPPAESDGLCSYPADLVMSKVASDVGLDGAAYSPRGRAVDSIAVSVSIGSLVKQAVIRSAPPAERMPVRCFLFASAAGERRRRYAGTYDARWQEEHCPLPPKDFDLQFFNAADPELIAAGYLQGGERVHLVNLSPRGRCDFTLPALRIWLRFRLDSGGSTYRAELWNVVLEPDDGRFSLSWGCAFPVGKQPARLREVEIRVTGETAVLGAATPAEPAEAE